MKFKEFGVKIETKCTNLMMEDICMKIENYTLIDSLCVIASRTIDQPNCTTCTVWALLQKVFFYKSMFVWRIVCKLHFGPLSFGPELNFL